MASHVCVFTVSMLLACGCGCVNDIQNKRKQDFEQMSESGRD